MIELDPALTAQFDWMKEPPTHAEIVAVDLVARDPRADSDPQNADFAGRYIATYAYGVLNELGGFVELVHLPRFRMGVEPQPLEEPPPIETRAFPPGQEDLVRYLVDERQKVVDRNALASGVRNALASVGPLRLMRSDDVNPFDAYATALDARLRGTPLPGTETPIPPVPTPDIPTLVSLEPPTADVDETS